MTIHNDYHHNAYTKVLAHNLTQTSTSAVLSARILQLRAQIALGNQAEVLADISGEEDIPDLAAVQALALYTSDSEAQGLSLAESLAQTQSDNATVQILAATVLAAAGKIEEALALVSKHQGTLEAVALGTQLQLLVNRTDLAEREVKNAKKWAQDSLLVNIAESWVGLRVGGDRYQQAFYEFEEMPVAQSVAEMHLGRLPEAETSLRNAMEDTENEAMQSHAIANLVVVETLAGRGAQAKELLASLQTRMPGHPLLVDLEEKDALFDEFAAKYAPKVKITA